MKFSERMSGWFAMGAADPLTGFHLGKTARSRLTLDVTVHVDDVPSFARTRDHAATLAGTVSFAPIHNATVGSGQVRLFAPSASGHGKVLAYDLGFTHEGQRYFLAGQKFVGGGAPWLMWPETTTLHAHLYRGRDAQSPVVAAGVLQISALGLLRTLTTFRGPGIASYGRFFAGELWTSYGLQRARPPATP